MQTISHLFLVDWEEYQDLHADIVMSTMQRFHLKYNPKDELLDPSSASSFAAGNLHINKIRQLNVFPQ